MVQGRKISISFHGLILPKSYFKVDHIADELEKYLKPLLEKQKVNAYFCFHRVYIYSVIERTKFTETLISN
jgi:hypothetical protein